MKNVEELATEKFPIPANFNQPYTVYDYVTAQRKAFSYGYNLKNTELLEALRELVELKDLKDRLENISDTGGNDDDLRAVYLIRKPKAWQAAREIIAVNDKTK